MLLLGLTAKLQHNFHQLVVCRQVLIRAIIVLEAALRTLAALRPGDLELGDAARLTYRVPAHGEQFGYAVVMVELLSADITGDEGFHRKFE